MYANLELDWKRESTSAEFNYDHYKKIETGLEDLNAFHQDFAFKLYHLGKYRESLEQIAKYEANKTSYRLTVLKASNYLELNDYEKAIESFLLSKNMIPSRFLPKYELFILYTQILKDEGLSRDMAKEINETPIKVMSPYVLSVKHEASKYLKIQ